MRRIELLWLALVLIAGPAVGCGGGVGSSGTSQTSTLTTASRTTTTAPSRTKTLTESTPIPPSATITAADDDLTLFGTPSRNIGCAGVGPTWGAEFRDPGAKGKSSVRCDINLEVREWEPPPKSAECDALDLDWGHGVSVNSTDRGEFVCAGDTVAYAAGSDGGIVVPYGSSIRVDQIVCTSRREGITCTNPEGHGFFLSRQRVDVF